MDRSRHIAMWYLVTPFPRGFLSTRGNSFMLITTLIQNPFRVQSSNSVNAQIFLVILINYEKSISLQEYSRGMIH